VGSASPEKLILIGEIVQHYRIDEVVGEGGMGVVYRAHDLNLERTVAVKVLSASFRGDREFVERFRQEARIQAGLNHPNIATLFDFFVWNDLPVAVMEFIEGETLRSMVDRTGPVPAHIALPLIVQALRGVAAGHKRGIIHRDLKPSNLMVTHEGTVKVTDFGIAKVRSATGLTQVSTRVGSASYMAPEQILGRPVDVHTDIYIMGGTLYELLCGRPPFQGLSQFEIDSAHVRDPPKAPTVYCANIPPAAASAVMRALAKEPSERFATAEEFIQALPDLYGVPYVDTEATRSTPPVTVAPDETLVRPSVLRHARTRSARTAIAITSLLIVLMAVGVAFYYNNDAGLGARDHSLWSRLVPTKKPSPTREPQPTAQPRAAVPVPSDTAVRPQSGIAIATAPDIVATAPAGDTPASAPGTPVTNPSDTRPSTPPDDPAPARSAIAANVPPDSTTIAPPPNVSRDLTGVWTGSYLDRSGRTQLQVVNLQMQQVTDGAITGRFTYKAAKWAGDECTLDKSSYSTQSKRLRLVVHCHNPNHPKYLNVPLEFTDVDPHASSIEGGRLAFHLADDIVVTLKRAKRRRPIRPAACTSIKSIT
jgi:eukaryotic-like serine/threonine-protein kinase